MVRRSDDGNRYGQHRGYEYFIEKHFVLSLGVTFIVTLGVLIGLLYLSACIPKEAIRENLLESAYYLEANEDEFYYRKENNRRTLIDNYADTIEFNIMYSVEEEHRLESLLISPFYSDNADEEYQMISILRERIEEEKEIDTVYDRYWHGIQMVMRPLFVMFDIVQIRILMISVLIVGLAYLVFALWKKSQKALALSMIPAAILISYPMLGMCMEYVPTFFIMLMLSLACAKWYQSKKMVLMLLFISGMCCGFFDILTTETVAVVIPMAIVLGLREDKGILDRFWKEILFVVSSGFLWGLGYLGVFGSKWLFSSLMLGSNRFAPAISMMLYRQGAEVAVESGSGLSQPMESLARNLRLLLGFPLEMEYGSVLMITGVILGIVACFVYLYRKTGRDCVLPALLALLAFVPVFRIMFLNSHSYQHSYFTYRALFASICCMITAVVKVVDGNLLKKKK